MEEGYGQFCTVARAAEALCERWSPLIIRELLWGFRLERMTAPGRLLRSPLERRSRRVAVLRPRLRGAKRKFVTIIRLVAQDTRFLARRPRRLYGRP
jgi:hypothetical protein